MKKKIAINILLIVLVSIGNHLLAQNTFKTIVPGWESRGVSIASIDSTFILMDLNRNSIIIEFDDAGIFKTSHYFLSIGGGGSNGSKSSVIHVNNNLVLLLMGNDSLFSRCIASFNRQTNSFNWITGFNINAIPVFPYVISQGLNNNYLITTHEVVSIQNYQCKPIVVITDSMGQLKNSYQFENHNGISSFTQQVTNNTYITGINYRDTIGPALVRFDTTGNVLWAKKYFSKNGVFYSSVKNNDGSLTIIGCPDTTYAGIFRYELFLMKVDTSGNVLWCKKYGDSYRSFNNREAQVKATNDGGYIITGYVKDSISGQYGKSDLIIIKTDASGDTLWTRTHGNKYTVEGGQDIAQAPDGGYIIAGFSSSDQFFPAAYDSYLIIKTDSLGMTSTHCQEFSTPVAVNNLSVFDSTISLTITTGTVSAIASSVFDTTLSIPQKNGCWLSALGVPGENESANQNYSAIPNPSNGLFTLKTNMENNDPITVLVYDILGHQVMPAKDFSVAEPTINLTSQPAGIYFVKIICQNKVQVVKVLKE